MRTSNRYLTALVVARPPDPQPAQPIAQRKESGATSPAQRGQGLRAAHTMSATKTQLPRARGLRAVLFLFARDSGAARQQRGPSEPSRAGPASKTSEPADEQRRSFILGVVQPGLAGLMDGSISSLAPLFAAAFATRNSWTAFLVGVATAIGAGISMAFSEGLSDDGKVSGRGSSWVRGPVCGVMTFLGAAGHTLPFLLPAFLTAVLLAGGVVFAELLFIAWIRKRYLDTPLLAAIFQVVVGGVIVFLAGILIGSA